MSFNKIVSLLGSDADSLLKRTCKTISKDLIRKPTLNYIEDSFVNTFRSFQVFHGNSDLSDAVKSAIITKSVGGVGLTIGRKSFHRPFKEGVELLNAVQDVYLCKKLYFA